MAKITWDNAIKNALEILQNKDNYAYFMGAKGQVLTDDLMEYLWSYYTTYFFMFFATQKKQIFNYSRGKIGFDCSGFVGKCIGDMSPSWELINHSTIMTTPVKGVAGSVLYKTGHVGLDIGYGFFLHFPVEMQSCTLGRIREYNWQTSGQNKYINYDGADSR